MGQKTHPHGLRLGTFRKWNNTWYASAKDNKSLFFHQRQVEDFLKTVLNLYNYTKISQTKKALVVDIKIFKFGIRHLFAFVFFYKFRSKKRKENTRSINKNLKKFFELNFDSK